MTLWKYILYTHFISSRETNNQTTKWPILVQRRHTVQKWGGGDWSAKNWVGQLGFFSFQITNLNTSKYLNTIFGQLDVRFWSTLMKWSRQKWKKCIFCKIIFKKVTENGATANPNNMLLKEKIETTKLLSRSAHRTPNFTNPQFHFPQFKVLQSVFSF